jgi:thymidylate synthase
LDETERVVLMDKKLGVTENLPPYYTEDKMVKYNIPKRAISLMWNQRSVDTFLGLPFNIASYGLLLEIIAREVNMLPDELIGNLGDVHLYSNHIEQAKEQIVREPFELPKVSKKDEYHYLMDENIAFVEKVKQFKPDWFKLENYQSHDKIKAPLSN